MLALCLHIAAQGQAIASLDDIDLSGLPKATKAKALRYWYDDDGGSVRTVTQLKGQQSLDVSALMEGLHTLHYQVIDENDDMADVQSALFMKMNGSVISTTAKQLRYWFDDDTSTLKTITATGGTQTLDASKLLNGLHTIHYQVIASDNAVYHIVSALFMKMDGGTETVTAKKLMYWFDDETAISTVDIKGGVQMLDASRLMDGLHTLHYQVLCSNGMLTSVSSALFMRMNIDAEATTAKRLRYWFDDDASTLKVIDVAKGTQTLDVSGLLTGLHTLCYQLIDSEGKVSTPYTHLFYKAFDKVVTDGQNRVTSYQYWLNANSQNMQTVELNNAANPYQLISLLPMQKEPIHSDCFHFEIANGQPTVYAKNIFHIRFHDAAGYFADGDRPFVDYSVKQVVTNAELLNNGDHKDTARPVGDDIKWYRLTAEPGDSVQFRLDRAATVQLFAPSGEEILSASASDVVKWFGCHVRESGTYYVALHDVTATNGPTVGIDYEHIDKYAVLRQDVTLVGNGGCSTITFEGNGFRDLYAVDLFTEQGDSIHHIYIGHESDATTSVVFDFTDAVLGTYNAKFRFAEEDKTFSNIVTVEEARDIELATTVTYPSTFLRSNGRTTYYAVISNEGNMTSYRTPVYVFVKSLQKDGVSRIKLSGLDLPALYDGIETENLDAEDKNLITVTNERIGDTHYFIKSTVYDETLRDSVYIWAAYFFADIAPESGKSISAEISTQYEISVWFTVPNANNPLSGKNFKDLAGARSQRYKITREEYCCMRSKIECFASIVADGVGIANSIASLTPGCPHQLALGVADCVVGTINQFVSATGKVMCDDPNYEENFWDRVQNVLNGISIVNTFTGCASKILPAGKFKDLIKAINDFTGNDFLTAFSVGVDVGNCINALTEQIPNCPPDNDNGGGPSTPVASMDPNDIYGYTAESGSHAVKDGLTDVYYRIEFENDTAFATASAHDIYVTDTLDATKFDLSTFKPTRVRIGEKSAELTGEKNFVTTIDMRPGINCIAQVEGTFDQKKGIAMWHISSLDPMTMEPTKYVQDGVLPVNTDGRGIGEVMYDIRLKPGLAHGTEIRNRAGIVFDTNDVIMTPTWTNVIDRVKPVSRVIDAALLPDGETAAISIEASDEGSGPWRYDVYVQYGSGAWFLAAENVAADTTATVKLYDGIVHHFYCVARDMAGNVEQKKARSEFTLTVSEHEHGDSNGDGAVDVADIADVIETMARGIYRAHADANGDGAIDVADIAEVISIMAARARAAAAEAEE